MATLFRVGRGWLGVFAVVAVALVAAAAVAVFRTWRKLAGDAEAGQRRAVAAVRRRRRPDAASRAQETRQEVAVSGLSRSELLRRGAAALAAGNVYALLDGLAAPPAQSGSGAGAAARAVPAGRRSGRPRARDRGGRPAASPPCRHGALRGSGRRRSAREGAGAPRARSAVARDAAIPRRLPGWA